MHIIWNQIPCGSWLLLFSLYCLLVVWTWKSHKSWRLSFIDKVFYICYYKNIDMFPNTPHVECVVLMSQSKGENSLWRKKVMILIFDYFETLLYNKSVVFNSGLKVFWEKNYKEKCRFEDIKIWGRTISTSSLYARRRQGFFFCKRRTAALCTEIWWWHCRKKSLQHFFDIDLPLSITNLVQN